MWLHTTPGTCVDSQSCRENAVDGTGRAAALAQELHMVVTHVLRTIVDAEPAGHEDGV